MESFAVDQDLTRIVFDGDAQFFKAGDGGKTVCTLKKIGYAGGSFREGAEHDGAVGDALISRDCDGPFQRVSFLKFHRGLLIFVFVVVKT